MADQEQTKLSSGEEIHLPGPSLLPFFVALGLSLVLVGATTTPILLAIGLATTIGAIGRWIKLAVVEFRELPPSH